MLKLYNNPQLYSNTNFEGTQLISPLTNNKIPLGVWKEKDPNLLIVRSIKIENCLPLHIYLQKRRIDNANDIFMDNGYPRKILHFIMTVNGNVEIPDIHNWILNYVNNGLYLNDGYQLEFVFEPEHDPYYKITVDSRTVTNPIAQFLPILCWDVTNEQYWAYPEKYNEDPNDHFDRMLTNKEFKETHGDFIAIMIVNRQNVIRETGDKFPFELFENLNNGKDKGKDKSSNCVIS